MHSLLTLDDVFDVAGADCPHAMRCETPIAGGSLDSRTLKPGELFFAFDGTRARGVDYIDEALAKGAVAAVASDVHRDPRVVRVDDVKATLHTLARLARDRSKATWIAVTGSVGKTTTRSLIASILRQVGSVNESPASFNNDLGVPLTILNTRADDGYAVVEVATSRPGEIRRLGELVRPNVAVITAAAESHLAKLGSVAGVAREKASLIETICKPNIVGQPSGLIGPCLQLKEQLAAEIRRGQVSVVERWPIESISPEGTRLRAPHGGLSVPLHGLHLATLIPLAVRAAEVARGGPLAPSVVDRGLVDVRPRPGRSHVIHSRGVIIIDDSYNANPASVRAAFELLDAYPCKGRRIAVVGDMLDLGAAAIDLHAATGSRCPGSATRLFTVGQHAADWSQRAEPYGSMEECVRALRDVVREGDVVLVKGSRSMGMERIVEALTQR